jgi:hypothetical protein
MPSLLITFNAHVSHATISVFLYSLYSSSLYHILQALLTCTGFSMLLNFLSKESIICVALWEGKCPCFTLVLSSWSDKCFVYSNPGVMADSFLFQTEEVKRNRFYLQLWFWCLLPLSHLSDSIADISSSVWLFPFLVWFNTLVILSVVPNPTSCPAISSSSDLHL